ncbi:MAG TPA: hypothetical protein PKE29_18785 [Phycisphaerales bacterium]|nr:hypothetical protein [Phycisphaerales bacterium]
MKPRPRIRKTIKWGGAAVTVLLVVVWVGSGWWYATGVSSKGWIVSIGLGRVALVDGRTIAGSSAAPRLGWSLDSIGHFEMQWLPTGSLVARPPAMAFVSMPLWAGVLCLGAAAAWAWRLDTLARRRAGGRLNLCPKCNYDRAGIGAGAVCPECGAAPTAPLP